MRSKFLLLLLALLLCACKPASANDPAEDSQLLYVVDSSVSYAFLNFEAPNTTLNIVAAKDAVSALQNNSADVIACDLKDGMSIVNTDRYRLLGVLGWGTGRIVSEQSKADSLTASSDMRSLLELLEEDLGDLEVFYFNSMEAAYQAYLAGETESVLLSVPYIHRLENALREEEEPAEETVIDPEETAEEPEESTEPETKLETLYDLSTLYQDRYGTLCPRIGVFIKKDLIDSDPQTAAAQTNLIRQSVNSASSSESALLEKLSGRDLSSYGPYTAEEIAAFYTELGLNFRSAVDCHNELEVYLGLLDIPFNEQFYVK